MKLQIKRKRRRRVEGDSVERIELQIYDGRFDGRGVAVGDCTLAGNAGVKASRYVNLCRNGDPYNSLGSESTPGTWYGKGQSNGFGAG